MFRRAVQFGFNHGFGLPKHDTTAPKQILYRTSRSMRNSIVLLLVIGLFTWHFIAGHLYWRGIISVDDSYDPLKPRVAIVTFITKPQTYLHLGLQNKDYYAKHHGYDLFVEYDSNATRGTTWLKFDMVENIIKAGKHDWIWYMDFDILITNTSLRLTDIIHETLESLSLSNKIDLLVTDDCNGLNDGSFITRSSSQSIEFFDAIRAVHDNEKKKTGTMLGDQDAMSVLLKSADPITQRAATIPQWKINAFPEEIGCYDTHKKKWEKGMFVVHFAGAWAHVSGDDPTGQLMRKYESEIIWGH